MNKVQNKPYACRTAVAVSNSNLQNRRNKDNRYPKHTCTIPFTFLDVYRHYFNNNVEGVSKLNDAVINAVSKEYNDNPHYNWMSSVVVKNTLS